MDVYHIWCNLKSGVGDLAFADKVKAYLGRLEADGLIGGFRLTRRKLGLGPRELGDFHIMVEVESLAQLEAAFQRVAGRRDPVEGLHFAVNSMVSEVTFALYRDFPDAVRHRGEEKF
jgi:hypothetical protein